MTSPVLLKLASATGSAVAKKFGDYVVQRWTRFRAEQFIEAFVESIRMEDASGVENPEVEERLDAILADDAKSELLFDAYRRVCFTKSKTLGPRIIGLLTGQLVMEERMAGDGEECIFEAAELLSDGEFSDFLKSYTEYRGKAVPFTDHSAKIRILSNAVIVRWNRQELARFSDRWYASCSC